MKVHSCHRFFVFALAAIISGAAAAQAQTSQLDDAVTQMNEVGEVANEGAVVGRIAADFTRFSGSEANATALVRGLRSGSEIVLEQNGSSTAFTPATEHLGYGEVQISLSLAKAQLERDGISDPSPDQIAAALNGGEITRSDGTVVSYSGILTQRVDGAGWGQIAKAAGFKLGPIIATIRSGKDHLSRLDARAARADARDTRPQKSQQSAKPDRAGKPERADRIDRPEKPERPTRVERPEKPERPGKS